MNIINVSVAELIEQQQPEYCVVPIGNQGEHGVTRILFDCTQFISLYGEGIAQLLHQRNGDGIPYIATVSQQENVITWDISGDDTARDGFGKLQLNWYVSGNLAKSCVLRTMVKKALTDATLIPEEVKSDLELLTEAVASKNPRLNAGTNVTITDNADGTQTISATGGGGSSLEAEAPLNIENNEIKLLKVDTYFDVNNNNRLTANIGDIEYERSSWTVLPGLADASMLQIWLDKFVQGDFSYDNGVFKLKDTVLDGKQDTLTAGTNIRISGNTISAIDTTYTAGTGLTLSGGQFGVDTTTIATVSALSAYAPQNTTYTKTEVDGLISAAIADVSALIGGNS